MLCSLVTIYFDSPEFGILLAKLAYYLPHVILADQV